MEFEFDPAKSEANQAKHGIDFTVAQMLWLRPTVEAPALTTDEPRTIVIGKISDKHWTAVVTQRGRKTRIISVRRSRDKERKLYEQQVKD